MSVDRKSAQWAWALGAHPAVEANPFQETSEQWLCFEAGRAGEPFPEHLLVAR